jgi:glycosyltransferase involved in cell wall biosynthesis
LARPLILIATLLRPAGETGIQTQLRHQLDFTRDHRPDVDAELVTPFSLGRACIPLFGVRYLRRPFGRGLAVRWYVLGHRRALQAALGRRVRRALREPGRGRIDLHVHDVGSTLAAMAVRARLPIADRVRTTIAFTVHYLLSEADEWVEKGVLTRESRTHRALARDERRALHGADSFTYLSRMMRDHVEASVPRTSTRRARVVNNGVRIPPLPPPPTRDLIAIGTLEPRKNQAFLLHVLAACRDAGRAYGLTIVGVGPDRAMLEQLVTDLALDEQVTFAGFVPRAATLIGDHRALVHGSLGESFGNVLLEALAVARPVFAAPGGAVPEVYDDGVEGHHWQLDDPRAAAALLMATLEDEQRWAAMSRRARLRAESLSWERQYGRLTSFVLGDLDDDEAHELPRHADAVGE